MGVRSLVWAVGLSVVGILGVVTETFAQNSPVEDSTLGIESSIISPSDLVDTRDIITGGAIRENNLFHSFSEFSVGENRSVYFSITTPGIQSVFSRVTGTERSEILGTLGTFGSSAPDLWLINPNGIIFGENAILDVDASFIATTADSIRFGSEEFSTVNPESPASTLTIAPSAYLFTQGVPATIESQSVVDGFLGDGFPGLRVRSGESLTFLGGDIVIDGGNVNDRAGLHAFGGRIQLGALGGPGEILTDSEGNIVFAEGTTRGDVELKNRARIEVSLDGGGDVNIFGRDITISGNSRVDAGISEGLGTNNSQAGDVVLDATQIVRVVGQSEIDNGVDENAIGNGGTIKVDSNALEVRDGGRLSSSVSDSSVGDAGDIEINVVGQATFNDGNIFSNANSETRGNRNNVTINVGSLRALNTSEFQALTRGGSDAGNIMITARDNVQFNNSNIFTSVGSGATGSGGNIQITAGSSELVNGSSLIADTSGSGAAGNVVLNVRDSVVFDNSNVFTNVEPEATGAGGNIQITTNSLQLNSRSQLVSDTSGRSNESDAGDIDINVSTLSVNSSQILTGTIDNGTPKNGDAGNVTITARDIVHFDDDSNIFSSVEPDAKGEGGNIEINSPELQLTGSSLFSARSLGLGNAGSINLNLQNRLFLEDSDIETESKLSFGGQIFITIQDGGVVLDGDSDIETNVTSGDGNGGDINVSGGFIIALDDSDILASSDRGRGGNIVFNVRGFFGENFTLDALSADPETLDGNDRVDINATGATNGLIVLPDISFIENSFSDLPDTIISPDQILIASCISRTDQDQGTFNITGSGGLPTRPNSDILSTYPTSPIQSPTETTTQWQLGDPINEATGVYQLADGRLALSQDCAQR